jgi:hypothetical protein
MGIARPPALDPVTFVVDASVVVRWLVVGPYEEECRAFLRRC